MGHLAPEPRWGGASPVRPNGGEARDGPLLALEQRVEGPFENLAPRWGIEPLGELARQGCLDRTVRFACLGDHPLPLGGREVFVGAADGVNLVLATVVRVPADPG